MSKPVVATANDPVIQAVGLGKVYAEGKLRTPVFDGLELAIAPGETVAIVGASGAGKSTLLHLLGGLDTPSAGEVYVAGQAMSRLGDRARGALRNRALGFIYQFHHLLPEFTALENVMMPLLIGGATRRAAEPRARELLDAVGLTARAAHKSSELSGGEQQRVAVARALANRPALLLADEPSGNLDTHTSTQLHDLFFRLRADEGVALVLATHNHELAARTDRVLEVRDGGLHPVPRAGIGHDVV